jgi:2-amino-4-hydroxy-6-hydroxymethyldihydropteridine diphosphokinase
MHRDDLAHSNDLAYSTAVSSRVVSLEIDSRRIMLIIDCPGLGEIASPAPPMDGTPQPEYVNAVAWLRTTLAPRALLDSLLGIEQAHGRSRGRRWAARTLDLDLVLYGGEIIDEPGLRLPHPGLTTRAFVLYPLAELVPQMEIPGAGPLPALCARVPADGLAVIED